MLNLFHRDAVNKLAGPFAGWLARKGVTPDIITVVGTAGTVFACLFFFPMGWLFVGAAVCTLFVVCDLLDGAVARALGRSSRFGAVLDSACDRIADGALFAGLTWYFFGEGDSEPLAAAALICLCAAQVTSYIKARAESMGLSANVGIVERGERYIIALVGVGLDGLGVPVIIHVAMWGLAALSLITVGERFVAVWRSDQEAGAPQSAGPPP